MWRDIEQMNRFAEELEEGLVEVRFDLVEERLLKEAKWYCNDGLAALKVAIGRETRRLVEAIEEEVGETMEGLAEEDGEYGEAMERHYGEAIEDEAYGQSMEDNERMEEADDDDLSPLLELGNPMSDGEY